MDLIWTCVSFQFVPAPLSVIRMKWYNITGTFDQIRIINLIMSGVWQEYVRSTFYNVPFNDNLIVQIEYEANWISWARLLLSILTALSAQR